MKQPKMTQNNVGRAQVYRWCGIKGDVVKFSLIFDKLKISYEYLVQHVETYVCSLKNHLYNSLFIVDNSPTTNVDNCFYFITPGFVGEPAPK